MSSAERCLRSPLSARPGNCPDAPGRWASPCCSTPVSEADARPGHRRGDSNRDSNATTHRATGTYSDTRDCEARAHRPVPRSELIRKRSVVQSPHSLHHPFPLPRPHMARALPFDHKSSRPMLPGGHLARGPEQCSKAGISVWVPETVSPHATWTYSWIRPPSRSRRSALIFAVEAGGCGRPAGGLCWSVRCGRCAL